MNQKIHKPGCLANVACAVMHHGEPCPGPYGKCNCDELPDPKPITISDGKALIDVAQPPMNQQNKCCDSCGGWRVLPTLGRLQCKDECLNKDCLCHQESEKPTAINQTSAPCPVHSPPMTSPPILCTCQQQMTNTCCKECKYVANGIDAGCLNESCRCHRDHLNQSHQSEKHPADVLVGFNPNFNYAHHSHRHCFSYGDKQPPCGIKLEDHKQCCLCDLKVSSSEKPPYLSEGNILKAVRQANEEQKKLVDEYHAKKSQANYVNSMTPEEQKADDELQRTAVITYTQHQPEQWSEQLEMYKKSAIEAIMTFDPKHTFCTICGTDPEALVARLNEVVASLLSRQKEQMLEVVRGTKIYDLEDTAFTVPAMNGYNTALSDVEEKIKAL